ncbi:nuclear transport factor 2 family protein [Lacihabitans sp. LS3-19]|uniref:nuclear transport factor 2 family protein n=1 Tax=Lacihabitans sp. LS3-19 TaxID=2487335 RepID=UPI0020CB9540|nr:nuclear transport factor 2 family protein [Lacihabitans sp. LS3-19]MCP9770989.1 nuclear transport factor 2 family protein [Lacihabitans sp. LS3-19]
MKRIFIFSIAIAFVGTTISCGSNKSNSNESDKSSHTDHDLSELKTLIENKTNQFTAAHITKDTEFLNHIFTENARSFPPNAEAVVGRKAISQLNMDWINYGISEAKETSTAFYGNEDYLIDEGTYIFIYGEDKSIDKGKYINIWKMEDGEWKIESNIWNSSQPL